MNKPEQDFAMFMDAQKMQALFQDELPDCSSGDWKITDCKIQHPRFKTYLNPKSRDKSFLALAYHLTGVNEQTKQADERILYVKAYLAGRNQDEYQKACKQAENLRPTSVLHLDKYGMIGWFFPYDPALSMLHKLLDKPFAKSYLADFLMLQQRGLSPVIRGLDIAIVNYRPEIRCTYRYDYQGLSGIKKTIFGKSFADNKGAVIQRRIVILNQHAKTHPGGFTFPPPLGYDENLNTLWLEGLAGQPLLERLDESNAGVLMPQVARHLLDFQSVTIPGLAVISEADMLVEIQKKILKLQNAFPGLAQRFKNLIQHLNFNHEHLPALPYRLSHGDFHIQQLLLMKDKRIALFDFDELVIASPLMDIANFSADLYALNLGQGLTERLVNSLFYGYRNISAEALNEKDFIWHIQLQLLTRAYRAYIQQKPNLEQLVVQYLETAETFALAKPAE